MDNLQLPDESETRSRRARPPIVTALAAQAVAFVVCFGVSVLMRRNAGIAIDLPLVLGAQGIAAGILGHRWGLARWWLPINMVLPIAMGAALLLDVPSWFFLVVFLCLALVFWNASSDRVPLYLTNRITWRAVANLLPAPRTEEDAAIRFLDLGSGLGGLGLYLADQRPDAAIDGIESAPLPFTLSWVRRRLAGPSRANATFRYGDFWDLDLGAYDIVYAFLSPEPMPRLFQKAQAEMKPGSLFISNSFDVPARSPDRIEFVDDPRQTKLMIWRIR